MAPSSDHQPPSLLNALLRQKAQRPGAEDLGGQNDAQQPISSKDSPHKQVNILPLPKTKMNQFQDSRNFDEGDYTPIVPSDLKKARAVRQKAKQQVERTQRRQKMIIHKRRVRKRRQVFFKRFKYFANVASFFVLAIMIWALIANPFWQFDGHQFELHNSSLLTAEQISPLVTRFARQPIYQIDPRSVESAIKSRFAIVDKVYVRRSLFPARLDLTVIEKIPFAAVYPFATSSSPATYATYEESNNHYGVVAVSPYALNANKPAEASDNPQEGGHPVDHPRVLPKLIIPPGYRLDQEDWQRIELMLQQVQPLPGLEFNAIQLVPTVLKKTSNVPMTVVIQYKNLLVYAGVLDAEVNKRVERLKVLSAKLAELGNEIQAVDLRWSEQMTFIKKGASLPFVLHHETSSVKAEPGAENENKASDTSDNSRPNNSRNVTIIDTTNKAEPEQSNQSIAPTAR